jgi:acyl dehydratase
VSIDTGIIGRTSPAHTVEVERGRLRFFAKVTGQTDPVYTDVAAARRAGHPDLPVPPTFLFCLNMESAQAGRLLADAGIDLRTILHGGQRFTYHALAYAGDQLTFATAVTDVFEKKGGALQFLVRTTTVHRDGAPIAELASTIVIRPKGNAA